MVVVNNLDEGANARAANDGVLGLTLEDGLRSTVDAGNESVRIRTLLASLIEGLNDDGLLSGVLTVEDDDNLTGLEATDEKERKRTKSKIGSRPPERKMCSKSIKSYRKYHESSMCRLKQRIRLLEQNAWANTRTKAATPNREKRRTT